MKVIYVRPSGNEPGEVVLFDGATKLKATVEQNWKFDPVGLNWKKYSPKEIHDILRFAAEGYFRCITFLEAS